MGQVAPIGGEEVKEVVETIVRALVNDPEKVSVTQAEEERSVIVEVRVPEEDLGRVIGKHGKVANSIRVLAKAAGLPKGKRVWVDINKLESASSPPPSEGGPGDEGGE
jgi:hypothetical protein